MLELILGVLAIGWLDREVQFGEDHSQIDSINCSRPPNNRKAPDGEPGLPLAAAKADVYGEDGEIGSPDCDHTTHRRKLVNAGQSHSAGRLLDDDCFIGTALAGAVLTGKRVVEMLVGVLDGLDDDFRVADNRHEVGVALPPRDHVGVDVV